MTAKQIFVALNSGNPLFVTAAQDELKRNAVPKVFFPKEQLDKMKGKYIEFLKQYKLLADAPLKAAGGRGGSSYHLEAEKVAPQEHAQLKALHEAINKKLEAAKSNIRYQPFYRNVAEKAVAPTAPAK